MADIQTVWDAQAMAADWVIAPAADSLVWVDERGAAITDVGGQPIDAAFGSNAGLLSGGDLYTAVLISLFSDAAAGDDDIIPDGTGDPRGWWAGPIGSKLWLRARSKAVPALLVTVRGDIEAALRWLIDDGVAAAVEVTTEYTRPGMLGAQVTVRRQDGARATMTFSRLWEAI